MARDSIAALKAVELPNMPHYEARATYARQPSGTSAWGNELAHDGMGWGCGFPPVSDTANKGKLR